MKLALTMLMVLGFSGPAVGEDVSLAPSALNSLSVVPPAIAAAPVMNQSGQIIGKVQRVITDQEGRPSAIGYTTADNRLVVATAPAVSYDGQKNILVVQDSPQRMAGR